MRDDEYIDLVGRVPSTPVFKAVIVERRPLRLPNCRVPQTLVIVQEEPHAFSIFTEIPDRNTTRRFPHRGHTYATFAEARVALTGLAAQLDRE